MNNQPHCTPITFHELSCLNRFFLLFDSGKSFRPDAIPVASSRLISCRTKSPGEAF